ncbi:S1/P1 nuclease [Rhodotorula paludigena]|uniref:S1/P1 nuclease n=1 Tax=Rhodotorula paludigena TaxID=86838 RepID=UPI003176345C
MRLLAAPLALAGTLLLSLSLPSPALAWGAAGHAIVATLAEIHLHPSVLAFLRSPDSRLVPPSAAGHLAPLATWADRIRMVPAYRGWSGALHYTSWEGDHPPEVCAWPGRGEGEGEARGEDDDEEGGHWHSDLDVLHAISNYTTRLADNPDDWEAFRFVLHFLGDVHQPMHLTSRERGGNGDFVLWEGRRSNLHSVWDGLLIARALREQHNYTTPLPSKQIESALTGRIYDPYIRLLLWEGVRTWWRDLLPSWLSCVPSSSSSPARPQVSSPHANPQRPFLALAPPPTTARDQSICPLVWASETHQTTCAMGFPEGYKMDPPLHEVGGRSEFYRKIRDSLTIERLLTQAGLRLASVLNTVLGPAARAHQAAQLGLDRSEEEEGVVNWAWMREAEREGW